VVVASVVDSRDWIHHPIRVSRNLGIYLLQLSQHQHQHQHKHPTMRIVKLLGLIIVHFLRWMTGYPRRRKLPGRIGFTWERKDLIDLPLRPLPPTRPRALTNTSQTHPQLQSALIARLPPEIRILIWEHIVGPKDAQDVLHIEVGDGILRQNRCYQQSNTAPGFQHDCWTSPWRESCRKGSVKSQSQPDGCYYAGPKHNCWTSPWRESCRKSSVKSQRQPDGCYYDFLPLLFTCKLM
jgi:hypothetical protein